MRSNLIIKVEGQACDLNIEGLEVFTSSVCLPDVAVQILSGGIVRVIYMEIHSGRMYSETIRKLVWILFNQLRMMRNRDISITRALVFVSQNHLLRAVFQK